MFTSRGLVCGPCFHQHEESDILADASRDHGHATAKLKEGAWRPHPTAGTAGVLALLHVAASFALVVTGARCPRCGRARADPDCPHAPSQF